MRSLVGPDVDSERAILDVFLWEVLAEVLADLGTILTDIEQAISSRLPTTLANVQICSATPLSEELNGAEGLWSMCYGRNNAVMW